MQLSSQFEVSVVIPVYNAEATLRRAVASVVNHECVIEVILVDDGSKDNSIEISRSLAVEYKQVKYFSHPNGANRGPGATRNLGVRHVNSEYIAFLDADDYYLNNRFKTELDVLPNSEIDCVTGFTGCDFANSFAYDEFKGGLTKGIKYENVPSEFWKYMSPTGHRGTFTTNAITLRTALFNRLNGFNERLRVSQDTEFWLRLSVTGRFYAKCTDIIAMRYVYEGNRSRLNNKIRFSRPLVYCYLLDKPNRQWFNLTMRSVFSTFFVIHLLRNITFYSDYTAEQTKSIIRILPWALKSIAIGLPNAFRFFVFERPNTA